MRLQFLLNKNKSYEEQKHRKNIYIIDLQLIWGTLKQGTVMNSFMHSWYFIHSIQVAIEAMMNQNLHES